MNVMMNFPMKNVLVPQDPEKRKKVKTRVSRNMTNSAVMVGEAGPARVPLKNYVDSHTEEEILRRIRNSGQGSDIPLGFLSENYMANQAQMPRVTSDLLEIASAPNEPMTMLTGYPQSEMGVNFRMDTNIKVFQKQFDKETQLAIMNDKPDTVLKNLVTADDSLQPNKNGGDESLNKATQASQGLDSNTQGRTSTTEFGLPHSPLSEYRRRGECEEVCPIPKQSYRQCFEAGKGQVQGETVGSQEEGLWRVPNPTIPK